MFRILATAICIAFPAHAKTTHIWAGGASSITLEPTTAPGAVAQVTFVNSTVHGDDEVSFVLELDGLSVTVDAVVGRGMSPDRMTVEVPPGYIADPPEIDVNEHETGTIVIYEYLGF